MSRKIFINYRGDDTVFTQALNQWLEDEFGAERLFRNVEGQIKPGDDFVHVLEREVAASDVVLAVIGPLGRNCWPHAPAMPTISSPSRSSRRSIARSA